MQASVAANPMSPTADGTVVGGKRSKIALGVMPRFEFQRGQRIDSTPLAAGTAADVMSKVDELRAQCASKFDEHDHIFSKAQDRVVDLEKEFVRMASATGV